MTQFRFLIDILILNIDSTVTIREHKREERKEIIQFLIFAPIFFVALTAKDIAMLIINAQQECSLDTWDGKSKYVIFSLSTWMNVAAPIHIFVMMSIWLFGVGLYIDKYGDYFTFSGFTCASFGSIFLVAWTVVGLQLQMEIKESGINDKQCGDIMLRWLILQMILEIGPGFLTICGICSS